MGAGRSSARFRSDGLFVPFDARQADGRLPGVRRRRRVGRVRRSIPRPVLYYVNANDLAWTGQARAEHGRPERPRAVSAALRRLPPRRSAGHAAADPVARRRRAPAHARRRSIEHRPRGAGRMPGFPALDQTAVDAIVQFLDRPARMRRHGAVRRAAPPRRRPPARSSTTRTASPATRSSSIPRAIPRWRRRGAR